MIEYTIVEILILYVLSDFQGNLNNDSLVKENSSAVDEQAKSNKENKPSNTASTSLCNLL